MIFLINLMFTYIQIINLQILYDICHGMESKNITLSRRLLCIKDEPDL